MDNAWLAVSEGLSGLLNNLTSDYKRKKEAQDEWDLWKQKQDYQQSLQDAENASRLEASRAKLALANEADTGTQDAIARLLTLGQPTQEDVKKAQFGNAMNARFGPFGSLANEIHPVTADQLPTRTPAPNEINAIHLSALPLLPNASTATREAYNSAYKGILDRAQKEADYPVELGRSLEKSALEQRQRDRIEQDNYAKTALEYDNFFSDPNNSNEAKHAKLLTIRDAGMRSMFEKKYSTYYVQKIGNRVRTGRSLWGMNSVEGEHNDQEPAGKSGVRSRLTADSRNKLDAFVVDVMNVNRGLAVEKNPAKLQELADKKKIFIDNIKARLGGDGNAIYKEYFNMPIENEQGQLVKKAYDNGSPQVFRNRFNEMYRQGLLSDAEYELMKYLYFATYGEQMAGADF